LPQKKNGLFKKRKVEGFFPTSLLFPRSLHYVLALQSKAEAPVSKIITDTTLDPKQSYALIPGLLRDVMAALYVST